MDGASDPWKQMTEVEARVAYDAVLGNELSGATPAVRDLEQRWRRWTGARHAMATSSGSTALLAAYFGLGIGPGDEVLCPSYTWINTVGPALLLGARPVFCESDPETLLLDPEDVRRRLTSRTRVIVAVHMWGHVCDLDALLEVGREAGIPLLEDCSHAPGARWRDRMVGTWGAAGCWSLQGAKPVSAGEGGVLATSSQEVFERACLVSQGSRMGALGLPEHAVHQPLGLGMKLRIHPLGAAIAGKGLDRLDALNRRRADFVEEVTAGLRGVPGVRPVRTYPGAQPAGYYGFPLLHVPEEQGGGSTSDFLQALGREGVAAAPADSHPLLHLLPLFARGYDFFTRGRGPLGGDYPGYREGDLPRTEAMHRRLFFLPLPDDASSEAAEGLVEAVRRAAERAAAT